MTTDVSTTPPPFWDTVAELVAAQVTPAMKLGPRAREPIITYLRDLECVARHECESRQAIQIIASGRHLLGDQSSVEPMEGPFSRT
jgi:hypothetical protein